MEITWLGQSCFRIKGSHAIAITDPYPPGLGYTMGKPTARIVTVSHAHPSHSYVQAVGGDPRIIHGPGEYEISEILVLGLATFHDAENGAKWGKNTVYLLEVDGLSVCHLGDIGHPLRAHHVEEIGNVDILLVPVGDVNTLGASLAAQVVRQLEPKIVIPMHYKTPALTREAEPVDKFLKEMGKEQVEAQPKLNVTKSNLPESTRVVVLTYPGFRKTSFLEPA